MRNFTLSIQVSPADIVKVLGLAVGIIVFLGIVSIPIHDSNLGTKFDMDNENSVPVYISSINLFFSAVLLVLIAFIRKREGHDYWRHWFILAVIFLLLSIDEMAAIHEDLAMGLGKMAGMQGEDGYGQYVWGGLGGLFVLLIAVFYLRFLFSLPPKTRNRFVLAAAVFVAGALGVEVLSGYAFGTLGEESLVYKGIVIIEEALEMVGVLLFIRALLIYIEENMLNAFPKPGAKVWLSRKNDRPVRKINGLSPHINRNNAHHPVREAGKN